MKKIFYLIFVGLLMLSSCSDETQSTIIPPNTEIEDAVLVYIAGDNNLSNYATDNLLKIKQGALNVVSDTKKVFVFIDQYNTAKSARLVEIKHSNGQIIESTIKNYGDVNSASKDVLRMVINDAFSNKTVKKKGIILWSHATAWLPASKTLPTWTRSFGEDHGNEMDIEDLKNALGNHFFDYAIFDACLMNSVEVTYHLKDNLKYILASPAETLAVGFPYDETIPELLDQNNSIEQRLKNVADSYYQSYLTRSGDWQSAILSLVSTEHIEELAALCYSIGNIDKANDYDNLSIDLQQYFYVGSRNNYFPILFDFKDYYSRKATDGQMQLFDELLNKIVLYKVNTPAFYATYAGQVRVTSNSGLSIYLPIPGLEGLNDWYYNLPWAKAVYN